MRVTNEGILLRLGSGNAGKTGVRHGIFQAAHQVEATGLGDHLRQCGHPTPFTPVAETFSATPSTTPDSAPRQARGRCSFPR